MTNVMTKAMTKTTMRIARCLLLAVGGSILITACDTTGSMKDASSSKGEAGWKQLEQTEIAKLFTGNTTAEESGRWAVHYAADGTKVVWVRNKGTETRKWWINDKSEWCSTLYKNSSESCGMRIEKKGEQLRTFDAAGNAKWTFRIEKGNSQNL
jgi:hypothetical protein